MQKLKQMVVMRESHERDEGTMGFHDYVTVKEDFNKFVDRVTEACETVNGKFLGVSYPNEDTAVILYRSRQHRAAGAEAEVPLQRRQ